MNRVVMVNREHANMKSISTETINLRIKDGAEDLNDRPYSVTVTLSRDKGFEFTLTPQLEFINKIDRFSYIVFRVSSDEVISVLY